ncbi:MAG: histidine kinase, partial [Terracidiphilus sp.]
MLSPAVATPATPTPVEEIAEALNRIAALHGLPLEDRLWLARNSQEYIAGAGEVLFEEGEPVEKMIIILKGEILVRRQQTGPMALLIARTGQMTGLLP